MCEKYFSPVLN